jgi:hypothetical protein
MIRNCNSHERRRMTNATSKGTVVRWSAITIVLGALLVGVQALAQFGDGVCQPGSQEATNRQCAILGSNVLEIVPPSGGAFPVTGTCHVNGSPVACAFWPYRFSGPSGDNQLNILIPAALDIYPNQTYPGTNTVFSGCQQVYSNGQGDPTTGFGKGIITYKTCRIAFNIDVGPGTPNLVLATALSSPGALPVQLKSGKNVFFDDILGPFTAGTPRLASTMEEITTVSGAILTVETNQTGGLVSATANTGPVTIIPPGIAVLCTPVNPANTYPNNFPAQYDCGPIVENLDGKNIQAGEHSTCYYRRLDGTLLKYTC